MATARNTEKRRAPALRDPLTRAEAATVLGITKSGVRWLENAQRLQARRGRDGVHRFERSDVERLRGVVQPARRRAAAVETHHEEVAAPVVEAAQRAIDSAVILSPDVVEVLRRWITAERITGADIIGRFGGSSDACETRASCAAGTYRSSRSRAGTGLPTDSR